MTCVDGVDEFVADVDVDVDVDADVDADGRAGLFMLFGVCVCVCVCCVFVCVVVGGIIKLFSFFNGAENTFFCAIPLPFRSYSSA